MGQKTFKWSPLLLALGCNAILGNEEGVLVGVSDSGGTDSSTVLPGAGKSARGGSASGSDSTGESGEPATGSGGMNKPVGNAGSVSAIGGAGDGGDGESGSAGMVSGGVPGNGGRAGAGGASGSRATGGTAGSVGTAGSAGAGGAPATGPYAPRTGSFKMLLYTKTAPTAYRHDAGIKAGIPMIQAIATESAFTLTMTETNEDFTAVGLSKYEIVFFLDTSGDVLSDTEQAAFETWMTTKNGAWAGTHSAADTEMSWDFYHELTGQQYTTHSTAGTSDTINWESQYASHPILKGLPSPWTRKEEWWNFANYQTWQTEPGFKILGRKESDGQPIIWVRETNNYRSFYSGLGHDANSFADDYVKKMLRNAIYWAVRRDPPPD